MFYFIFRMPELKEKNNITKMIESTAIIDREFISITVSREITA